MSASRDVGFLDEKAPIVHTPRCKDKFCGGESGGAPLIREEARPGAILFGDTIAFANEFAPTNRENPGSYNVLDKKVGWLGVSPDFVLLLQDV